MICHSLRSRETKRYIIITHWKEDAGEFWKSQEKDGIHSVFRDYSMHEKTKSLEIWTIEIMQLEK